MAPQSGKEMIVAIGVGIGLPALAACEEAGARRYKDNDLAGKLVGGNWSDTGFYGIADNNTVCLSWNGSDKPRLRCMDVFLVDGVLKKFTADGSLSGTIVKYEDGKIL